MGWGLEIAQRPELQQRLSAQMQHSLALLQAPALELQALVRKELQENPVLEELPPEGEIPVEDAGAEGVDSWKERLDRLMDMDQEWRDYFAQDTLVRTSNPDSEEKRQFLLDSLTPQVTLAGSLREQVRTTDLPEELWGLADQIIGRIDTGGYLRNSEAELALATNRDAGEVGRVVSTLRTCDPPGVAARDLRQCLMLQLERSRRQDSLEYRILDRHFGDLGRRDLTRIARDAGTERERVAEAVERIGRLDPRPGNRFAEIESLYVAPEVRVVLDGEGEPVASLERDSVPRIRVGNSYKDMLSRAGAPEELREYVQEKIRSGRFLIRCIDQRQETLQRVAQEMAGRQREFFASASGRLVPMTMAQVAKALEIHDTTVSRAVAGKYLRCSRGVFPLRHFFTASVPSGNGEAVSSQTVRERIGQLVSEEDPASPLTDGQLVERMGREGFRVARRTIVKYRGILGIPSSRSRRVR